MSDLGRAFAGFRCLVCGYETEDMSSARSHHGLCQNRNEHLQAAKTKQEEPIEIIIKGLRECQKIISGALEAYDKTMEERNATKHK